MHVASEGRKQIQFSLKTADRNEAAALARRYASEQDARWGLISGLLADAPSLKVPTIEELEEAAVAAAYDVMVADADDGRRNMRGKGPHMWRGHVNLTLSELEGQKRLSATHDYTKVSELADLVCEIAGFDIDRDSEKFEHLCDLLNRQLLNALTVKVERNDGNAEFDVSDTVIRRSRERGKVTAKGGESIMELFKLWTTDQLERGEKRQDTVNANRQMFEQFVQYVGVNRAIDSITPGEMAEYRDTLRDLPPKWRSKNDLKDLSMREAATKARQLNLRKTSHTRVNNHLSMISPLYKWLAQQPRWAGLRNPCDGLFYRNVRGKNRRPSFTTQQLNEILSSLLFVGFEADDKEHKPGGRLANDWRKWIPLVCMFTGARIGEIAQLTVSDISEENGIWVIQIRHNEVIGQSTKSGNDRPAVIHHLLQEIGFADYVTARKADASAKTDPLFPEVRRDARGQYGATVSRWWRKYLTRIGVKDGADGIGAHAFRHTLADKLRSEAELLDPQIAVCLGHDQPSTTRGYGRVSQGTVKMLKGWIDSVQFDAVDFSHLLPNK